LKRFCIFLTVILIFLTLCQEENVSADDLPCFVLIEADTGTVLEENNSERRINTGYLTKLMSLLIIAEDIQTGKFRLTDELTASESVKDTKGAVIWLEQGDRMSAEELLKAVIIGNANDALTVLAENCCENTDEFVKRMNSRAFDLGLHNSAFFSPYGYYDEREYSSAHDIAIICSELSRYEFLTPYFSTWRDFVKSGTVELVSENTLSRSYERHIGFKACHSDYSGYCIAEGGRNEEGITYIAVVLGAESDDVSLGKAKKLVNKGFSDYKITATMFPDDMLMPVKVRNGEDFAVEISLKNQSTLVIPKGVSELRNITVIPDFLDAPVKSGQKIGTVGFYNGDTLVCETDIITKSEVKKLSFSFIFKKMMLNMLK